MIDLAAARVQFGRGGVLLPDPVPAHPLLDGRKEIGRGEYSIVLDNGDGERVYKIVSSPADYFLYTADDRPRADTSTREIARGRPLTARVRASPRAPYGRSANS